MFRFNKILQAFPTGSHSDFARGMREKQFRQADSSCVDEEVMLSALTRGVASCECFPSGSFQVPGFLQVAHCSVQVASNKVGWGGMARHRALISGQKGQQPMPEMWHLGRVRLAVKEPATQISWQDVEHP